MIWIILVAVIVLTIVVIRSQRWKSKMRIIGRRRKNWIRFHPNPGFQIGKLHYCRFHGWKPHDTKYKYQGKIEQFKEGK